MIFCINPECQHRQNSEKSEFCQACGTSLVIQNRYRLLKSLRPLDDRLPTELFEVDDRGTQKVMKILKIDRADAIDRFDREASILQWMNHPGIPRADLEGYFTVSIPNRSRVLHCLVMEKIEGLNLEKWVKIHGKISQKQVLLWMKQLLEVLDAIHREGFFHRDIKPSNIMCKPDSQLVLIDFGAVRELTDTYLAKLKRPDNLKTDRDRITSVISGGYTPQEQIDGKALPQSDFFALGRTFVYLLTGTHPTDLPIDSATGQLKWRHLATQISPLLADFIDELMAQLPRNRPQNAIGILPDLNPHRLRLRQIRYQFKQLCFFLQSREFKFWATSLLTLIVVVSIINRLSFPEKAEYYYNLGLVAQQEGQLGVARQGYEQALKYQPDDYNSYNNLGLVCKQLKDLKCAENYYHKSLEIEQNSGTLYNLGQVYEQMEELDFARMQYQRAIELGGETIDYSLSALARLSILQGDLNRAIELSQQGLQQTQKPKVRSSLYRNLGWVYWIQADYAKAEDNLKKALQWQEDRTEAYCLLALVQESQSRKMEALKQWQLCRDGDAKNRVEILSWQTMARQRLLKAQKIP